MSLLSYRTHISLTGGMKKLVRILDAAKKNLETDKGFEIKFELLEEEDRPVYVDWLDWSDIARVYGVTIFEGVELYQNGVFVDCCGSYIYEPDDGHPNKE